MIQHWIFLLLFTTAVYAERDSKIGFGLEQKLPRTCDRKSSHTSNIDLLTITDPQGFGQAKNPIFETRSAYAQSTAHLLYEIRDPTTKPARFRKCLEKIGEYLALDVLKTLPSEEQQICTLTNGIACHSLITETPVLVTILRAGLPLNAGVHQVFPNAEVGFIAMARNEETLQAAVSYIALPSLTNRYVIITDTMLATGGSLLQAIKLVQQQSPKKIIVISAIAAEDGIKAILNFDSNIEIYAATIDPILNEKGYIVPGLGDAGDRCYGQKHNE